MSSKPIEETLSYTLAQICKAHRTWADEVLAEVGLHVGQEMFLTQLWKQDGQAQSEMAANMCVQPPTVNKMLSRMENAGLVERRTDAEDNREPQKRGHCKKKSKRLMNSLRNTLSLT
jgi:MarR family transcriptional regulator, organic hydroperoxide resistance regulator